MAQRSPLRWKKPRKAVSRRHYFVVVTLDESEAFPVAVDRIA
jgi:hypothetical protein